MRGSRRRRRGRSGGEAEGLASQGHLRARRRGGAEAAAKNLNRVRGQGPAHPGQHQAQVPALNAGRDFDGEHQGILIVVFIPHDQRVRLRVRSRRRRRARNHPAIRRLAVVFQPVRQVFFIHYPVAERLIPARGLRQVYAFRYARHEFERRLLLIKRRLQVLKRQRKPEEAFQGIVGRNLLGLNVPTPHVLPHDVFFILEMQEVQPPLIDVLRIILQGSRHRHVDAQPVAQHFIEIFERLTGRGIDIHDHVSHGSSQGE